MSDDPSLPPSGPPATPLEKPRQPSSDGRPPLKARTGQNRPVRKKLKPEHSNMVGYAVLGIGVLSVIAVIWLAVHTRSSVDDGYKDVDARLAKLKIEQDAKLIEQMKNSVVNAPTVPQMPVEKPKESYFNRQPSITLQDIKGTWKANMGKYLIFLDLKDKDMYQIVIVNPQTPAKRVYSSGVYTLYEDILLFIPRPNWPQPAQPVDVPVFYEQLVQSEFPLLVAMQKGRMLWQNPPPTEKRVIVPRRNPVFMSTDINYIVWQRM